jgi:N-acetylglucosaminyldiphosphoundecaprenol N-acetyl-beta-D-mannosaminyltransferase
MHVEMIDAVPTRLQSTAPPIAILGVPFDNLTTADAVDLIERMIESRRPHYLVTANVDFLVQAQQDVELRRIFFDAHLVLCDGTPLVWASRLLGNPLPERVAGADLVPLLIRIAAEKRYRLFFLGATAESAGRAVQRLTKEHPELLIAGHYSPPFRHLLEMDHDEIARRIREAKPDLLFVSFGCPKQEKWIAMHYRSLGVPVAVGVGATIDFLAGSVKRAPVWMQRTGTEWLFRLAQEPRRLFKRYAKDLVVFGWRICAQWWRLQFRSGRRGRAQAGTPFHEDEDWHLIQMPERLDMPAVRDGAVPVERLMADTRHCLLDLSRVEFIDSTGVGLLIRLRKNFRGSGRQLVLLSPGLAVRRALSLMRLEHFFDAAPDRASARRLIESRSRERVVCAPETSAANQVAWHGEITAANADEVWEATREHLTCRRTNGEFTIDLSQVRFMDSSGIGVMVRARKWAQRENVKLEFRQPQPAVRNVLHLARLEEFLLGR